MALKKDEEEEKGKKESSQSYTLVWRRNIGKRTNCENTYIGYEAMAYGFKVVLCFQLHLADQTVSMMWTEHIHYTHTPTYIYIDICLYIFSNMNEL